MSERDRIRCSLCRAPGVNRSSVEGDAWICRFCCGEPCFDYEVGDVVTGTDPYWRDGSRDFIGRVYAKGPGMTEVLLDNDKWIFVHKNNRLRVIQRWNGPDEAIGNPRRLARVEALRSR